MPPIPHPLDMPKKRLKQTIQSLCSPLNVPQQQNNSLCLSLSSMNKQRSLTTRTSFQSSKRTRSVYPSVYHYSLKLVLYQSTSPHATVHAEIYKPTFKTLTGSSNDSESWKEMTRKIKENSSANAVKWRQSAKRVEWAFPHGQPTPSPDFRARSVHTGFRNLGGMSMNIQRKNFAHHFRIQSEREQTLAT